MDLPACPMTFFGKSARTVGIALSFCYICAGAGARRASAGDRIPVDTGRWVSNKLFVPGEDPRNLGSRGVEGEVSNLKQNISPLN